MLNNGEFLDFSKNAGAGVYDGPDGWEWLLTDFIINAARIN